MIRAIVTVAAVLVIAAPAHASGACRAHGSKTLRSSKVARVYELRGTVYACLYTRGHRYKLGVNDKDFGDTIGPIRLRGPYVAYASQYRDTDFNDAATVAVKDLRSGRALHKWSDNGDREPCNHGSRSSYWVGDLALAPTGAVAWIAVVTSCDSRHDEVTAIRTGKPREVLDDSKAVEWDSLRYARGSIFWRHPERLGDRGQRSAPLE